MDKVTIDTYNKSAKLYAEKFAGVGPRTKGIDRTFAELGLENPRVLELGCGDGRDAAYICEKTTQYKGIDLSVEMVMLAKERLLKGEFEVADICEYGFDDQIDVVFAFASLLHLDKSSFSSVLARSHEALSENGLFWLVVKEGEYKGAEKIMDSWGERIFYFYEVEDIKEMAKGYEILFSRFVANGKTNWLNVLLRKI
jgi:trans-aconitate methyltransferase